MTAQHMKSVADQYSSPLDRRNVADTWRFGYVFKAAPGFGPDCVVETNEVVTLKPGESLETHEAMNDCIIAIVDR